MSPTTPLQRSFNETFSNATGCPLRLEKLEMLEKPENEPYVSIWLEKLENHRFSPALA